MVFTLNLSDVGVAMRTHDLGKNSFSPTPKKIFLVLYGHDFKYELNNINANPQTLTDSSLLNAFLKSIRTRPVNRLRPILSKTAVTKLSIALDMEILL